MTLPSINALRVNPISLTRFDPSMEYCCYIWASAPASTLSMLNKIQVGPLVAHHLSTLSLSHRRLSHLFLFSINISAFVALANFLN